MFGKSELFCKVSEKIKLQDRTFDEVNRSIRA